MNALEGKMHTATSNSPKLAAMLTCERRLGSVTSSFSARVRELEAAQNERNYRQAVRSLAAELRYGMLVLL